ncbi:MAG TPA: class I SAM-dependent methyltransferase [Solirubrobacterales bacterium]|nr:class I SAM-dependent methyltransferase [Solirubrobacterales bacterium]
MDRTWTEDDAVRRTYDALAASYDDFTLGYGYRYETWTATLLARAEEEGLQGNRMLDVACGTGFSFITLLERGFQVTGCDVSPAMIEAARAKVGDRAELHVADMRELPDLGEFDLIWSINSAMNYLLSSDELTAALAGMRRNLAPQGLLLFDLMSLKTARTFFTDEFPVEQEGKKFRWKGLLRPGEVVSGQVGGGHLEEAGKANPVDLHRMRHFAEPEVLAAIEAAGLDCVRVLGENDGDLHEKLDEETEPTAVYICRL